MGNGPSETSSFKSECYPDQRPQEARIKASNAS